MSAAESSLALGRRIADRRRRLGLTQLELAGLLGRPAAWVAQVERGLLQPGPVPGAAAATSAPDVSEAVSCARASADESGQAAALLLVLSGDRPRRPGSQRTPATAHLRATAADVWALAGARRHADLAGLLGDLVPDLEAAVRAAPRHQQAGLYELLAASYQACAAALARLGEPDAALTAATRAMNAADRAGDLPAVAASAYLQVCILMETRRHAEARKIAAAAAGALAGLSAGGSMDALALRGALTLLHALSAARAGDTAVAEEQLSRARLMAARISGPGLSNGIGFGPGHVALYEIAVSIETSALLRAPANPAEQER